MYFAHGPSKDARLIAHLHGVCGPPSYACGKWIGAGTRVGAVVCPTGNTTCGNPADGIASWEAPSWEALVVEMDRSLEAALARVIAEDPHAFRREDAVLTGFSRGAYAVPIIAAKHPGRWPYLLLIEADAPMNAKSLALAGVRSVALVAGEHGSEIAGMRKRADELTRGGIPSRLFVMRKTSHLYPEDMEDVMREALSFVIVTP